MAVRIERIQMNFYPSGDQAARLLPVSFEQWEQRAKETLAAAPFGHVYGAAGAGDTHRGNMEAFRKYRLRPRVCCEITECDLSVSLLGRQLPVPFLLAPIGVNSILHPDGELAPARAAAKLNVPYILSNVSSLPLEKVASVMGDRVRWFQLYPPKNHELTASFLGRAEAAGYSAIAEAVRGRVPLLLDSGVRRGVDVLKAIAPGASAVLVGRPYAYALAVAGESGVHEVLQNLIAETELQLAISGRSAISDIDRSLVIEA